MEELYKKISGDWFDIKDIFTKYYDLYDYFKTDNINIYPHIEKLKFSVEHGITEYKKNVISPFFRIMENVKFQTPNLEEIKNQKSFLNGLLFTIITQRLIANGSIPLFQRKNNSNNNTLSVESIELKDIFTDINERIKRIPQIANNPYYKNILIQIPIIKKEQETMKKLLPTIKQEARESFLNNFKNTFSSIESKIRNNYKTILDNDRSETDTSKNVFEIIQSKQLVHILTRQSELVSKLRSILSFSIEDKYKIREVLLRSVDEKKDFFELISLEENEYKKLKNDIHPEPQEHQNIGIDTGNLSRTFCREIIRIFEKDL